MSTCTFNGHDLTADTQQPGGCHYTEDASHSNYLLIQFSGHLHAPQVEELRTLGVQVLNLLNNDTYTCYYEHSDLSEIRNLPYVVYANVYHVDLAVSPTLKQDLTPGVGLQSISGDDTEQTQQHSNVRQNVTGEEPSRAFYIALHDSSRVSDTSRAIAEATSVRSEDIVDEGYGNLRVRLTPSDVYTVASLDDVASVYEILPTVLHNNEARKILHSVDHSDLPSYSTKDQSAIVGMGQVVVVADTGFDKGQMSDIHPAFGKRVYDMARRGNILEMDYQDIDGHGTHVAGSVLGYYPLQSNGVAYNISGTATGALLWPLRISSDEKFDALTQTAATFGGIFEQLLTGTTMRHGSDTIAAPRVHNNSWGNTWSGSQTGYQGPSNVLDNLIWNNQDWVVVFSAGNDANLLYPAGNTTNTRVPPPKTICGFNGAKNVITVGSCDNRHPLKADIVKGSFEATGTAGRPSNISDFSSRGPTYDNRLKPDVVAPGCVILSARSRNQDAANRLGYANYGASSDPNLVFSSGTSMAAPLVSGICAVLRAMYFNRYTKFPSAAMVKALLVNGADDLQYNPFIAPGTPNADSGWGRVNQKNSLAALSSLTGFCYDSQQFTASNEAKNNPFRALDPVLGPVEYQTHVDLEIGSTLIATLVWTDAPGTVNAGGLVNRLGLALVKPTAVGAPVASVPSEPQAPTTYESNVRRITYTADKKGRYWIKATCISTLQTDANFKKQHFALCYEVRHPAPPGDLIDFGGP